MILTAEAIPIVSENKMSSRQIFEGHRAVSVPVTGQQLGQHLTANFVLTAARWLRSRAIGGRQKSVAVSVDAPELFLRRLGPQGMDFFKRHLTVAIGIGAAYDRAGTARRIRPVWPGRRSVLRGLRLCRSISSRPPL